MKPIEENCRAIVVGGEVEANFGREVFVVGRTYIMTDRGLIQWMCEAADGDPLYGWHIDGGKVYGELVANRLVAFRTCDLCRIDDWEADEDDTTTIIDMQMTNA